MSWRPPLSATEHWAWLRTRWSQQSLRSAATMTFLASAASDGDADQQLRQNGMDSLGRLMRAGLLRRDLTVAEIGCGVGRVATELCDYLSHGVYYGVELSPEYIRQCQRRCPNGRFLQTPGIGFPLEDACVDLVVEFTVFPHMPVEAVYLWMMDVRRVLKADGRSYLQFHNLASDSQWAQFVRCAAEPHRFLTDPGYPRALEWATVERLHQAAGLAIEAVHPADENPVPESWFVVGHVA